jgi:hypothetical protein
MSNPRRRIPTAVTLIIGLALGWGMANHRPQALKAVGGDRYGDYSLTTGPISIQYNERTKTQAPQDALYFLDYKGARLLAMVPVQKSSTSGSQIIDSFVERDLTADFKVDLERGVNPHFLMTPGSLGAYGEGWAPLFVFETTTKQVAAYKLLIQSVGLRASSRFELLEIKSYATLPSLPAAN